MMVQNAVRYHKNGKQIECYWKVKPMKELVYSGATPLFYDYSVLFVPVVAVFVNAIEAEDLFVKRHGFTLRFTHFFHRRFRIAEAEERWMDLVLNLSSVNQPMVSSRLDFIPRDIRKSSAQSK
jgi:hypothetical protein